MVTEPIQLQFNTAKLTRPVPGSVYFYAPNKGAPAFFAVAFAISGGFHAYQCM